MVVGLPSSIGKTLEYMPGRHQLGVFLLLVPVDKVDVTGGLVVVI